MLFQRDLGTLAEKQTRISEVAQTLSQALGADKSTVKAAGYLIKADLVSDMVGEFPELQGIAGRHYALHDDCLLYTSPSPRDVEESRMPSSA